MRCPTCGEDNREGALLCELCRTLFAAPARAPVRSQPPVDRKIAVASPPARSRAGLWAGMLAAAFAVTVAAAYQRHRQARRQRLAVAAAPAAIVAPVPPAPQGAVPLARVR